MSRPSSRPAPAGWPSTATKRTVDLVLEDGARHTANLHDPAKYEVTRFARVHHRASIRTRSSLLREILKGDNEMTDARAARARGRAREAGLSPHGPIMALHRKFAIPFVCFTFALIGLGLGLTQRT